MDFRDYACFTEVLMSYSSQRSTLHRRTSFLSRRKMYFISGQPASIFEMYICFLRTKTDKSGSMRNGTTRRLRKIFPGSQPLSLHDQSAGNVLSYCEECDNPPFCLRHSVTLPRACLSLRACASSMTPLMHVHLKIQQRNGSRPRCVTRQKSPRITTTLPSSAGCRTEDVYQLLNALQPVHSHSSTVTAAGQHILSSRERAT